MENLLQFKVIFTRNKFFIIKLFLTSKQMHQLDSFNPDWQQAGRHGLASKAGLINYHGGENSALLCKCCYNVVYKDPIPLCSNSKSLSFLGFGFPLFYTFVKNCIILLISLICTYSAYSLKNATASNWSFCDEAHRRLLAGDQYCDTFMVWFSSIQSQVSDLEEVMRIVSFCFHFCLLVYMRDHMIKLQSYYDQRNTSMSDYSIMMKNIPRVKGIKKKLKNFFQKQFKRPHTIKQIILISQNPQVDELNEQKEILMNKLRTFYEKQNFNEEFPKLQRQLKQIKQDLVISANKIKIADDNDKLEAEKAILVFNTDDEKDQILKQFDQIAPSVRGPYFGLGCEDMKVKEAPEPKEILWKNINVSNEKKILLRLLGWGLSLLLLVIATIVFYFILVAKAENLLEAYQQYKKDKGDSQKYSDYQGGIASVYILLFVVVLFNKLLMVVLFHKFTDLERNYTMSKFQFSFALKYCLGLFFTTALMTLAVEAIKFQNYYQHPYGVIEEETIMFFMNAFFVPLFWLVNPFHIIKSIKRSMNHGKQSLTQAQANLLMQDTQYDMGKRYAEIIETMWFTYLYATLVPIGAFISVVGIIIYYWIDKYNLLRRSAVTTEVSGKLALISMNMLDFTLILLPIGSLMFDKQIRHTYKASQIVMLIFAFIYIVAPVNKIIEFFNQQQFKPEQKSYDEVKDNFKNTYQTEHPIIKIIEGQRFSRLLMKKGHSFSERNQTLGNLNESEEKVGEINLGLKEKVVVEEDESFDK